MITTGIIKEINLSSGNHKNNRYLVELALFQIPGDSNKSTFTYQANCMVPSGFSSLYKVDDKVYVGFVNDDKSSPIILGKIYQGVSDIAQGYGCLEDLKVSNSAIFPKNITIGDYNYSDIDKVIKGVRLIEDNYINREEVNILLEEINSKINDLNSKLNDLT